MVNIKCVQIKMVIKQTKENYFLDKNAGGNCYMAD